MRYKIRTIDNSAHNELDWVTLKCMETILETIPEFEEDEQLVKRHYSNFTFSQMRKMIADDIPKKDHQILVIEYTPTKELVGHSIFSIKKDTNEIRYGHCYSRYISPDHRRKGLASKLLVNAEDWWLRKGAKYAIAHTHIHNYKLQKLFLKFDYLLSDQKEGKAWPYFELLKQLKQSTIPIQIRLTQYKIKSGKF